jgi:hypothetical protein
MISRPGGDATVTLRRSGSSPGSGNPSLPRPLPRRSDDRVDICRLLRQHLLTCLHVVQLVLKPLHLGLGLGERAFRRLSDPRSARALGDLSGEPVAISYRASPAIVFVQMASCQCGAVIPEVALLAVQCSPSRRVDVKHGTYP